MKRLFFVPVQLCQEALLRFLAIFLVILFSSSLFAQEIRLSRQYVGFLPSVLIEPYDTINAVEINTLPFVYEFRWGSQNSKGVQLRPIVNYRLFKNSSGISHVGGTILMNWYLLKMVEDEFWLKPQLGSFYTYSYNRLEKVQTMTLGIELGAFVIISNQFSLALNVQPGLNYYPDQFSKDFVEEERGFKPHFGFIFHLGYNF
ncbi:MAG: hypothetical protein Kow0075_09000 [Salibacteraceae bacterium]